MYLAVKTGELYAVVGPSETRDSHPAVPQTNFLSCMWPWGPANRRQFSEIRLAENPKD